MKSLVPCCLFFAVVLLPSSAWADTHSGALKTGAKVADACGGPEKIECQAGAYCMFADFSCGENGEGGVCKQKADICPMHLAPVCGCDGKTYSNNCVAARSMVSVRHNGACGGKKEGVKGGQPLWRSLKLGSDK